jgi:biotin carboxylase
VSARRSPTLVVLGGGPAQRHAIDAARAMDVRTIVCDSDPRVGDVRVSTEDIDGVREIARNADGVIAPGTDWPVRIAAEVAHDLGLPHPISVATARICTDKLEQRARLGAAGVLQPAWSADDAPAYPCVVKAPDRQGQRAMAIVTDPAGLPAATDRARAAARGGQVLYERFVPGPEVTVDGFLKDGRNHVVAVTDRVHFADAPGIAQQHVYPSAYPDSVEAAAETASRALDALGVESGPTYVQLILGPDGPCVIEVAARLGGGHDSELLRRTVGVDLAAAAVRAALGWEVLSADLQPHPNGAGVVEFLRAPEGELVATEGPPEAHFYHPRGHTYGPLVAAASRAGYVLETGADRREAIDRAEAAVEHIRFEVI